LKSKIDIKLIDSNDNSTITGITIIPVYMTKGLEFDAVMVYQANSKIILQITIRNSYILHVREHYINCHYIIQEKSVTF